MLSSRIKFFNFKKPKSKLISKKIRKNYDQLIIENNTILQSLSKNYKDNFDIKLINKFKKFENFRIFGMGGSSLGAQAIYQFMKHKIKKNFNFIDNLQANKNLSKKNNINIVISKSGNTIETIANTNVFIKKSDKNIFITENKKNYLYLLAEKLKAEIIHHNNFIGGRYSVLSEVGMLPVDLMGLKSQNVKQFNSLIKNKKFLNALIENVSSILFFIKRKKFNSVIINYDEKADSLFKWYQQLVAESLGKDSIGILPIVSNMPKDNHSVMQLYLDGYKNNFFTFFYVNENKTPKINNIIFNKDNNYLKNKNLSDIIYAQFKATQNVFAKKNIPFRSFEIKKRNEKTLGELVSFFILETILLGRALNINPYNQPAVELIKKETNKILL